MFKHLFITEIKYSLQQPMVYIFLGLIAFLTCAATVSDSVIIGGSVGNIHKNAPFVISQFTVILTLFGLLIATAFFNNAALRDHNNGFTEILFSTPLKKSSFFFGRFLGALLLATIPLLGVFIGIVIGSVLGPAAGWIDADRMGPIYWSAFVSSYFLFVLPNMFVSGTVIFALASYWKSTVFSFVGALLIIVTYIISGTLLSDIDNEFVSAVTDIFGIRTYFLQTKYYTQVDKNTLVLGFSGLLLINRLIWFAFGIAVLLFSYITFSFKEKSKKVKQEKHDEKIDKIEGRAGVPHHKTPLVNLSYGGKTNWLHFKSFFSINLLSIVKNNVFKIIFLFGIILLLTNLNGGFEYFGLKSYPLTYKVLDFIGSNAGLFNIIVIVFFSGELVWRDRVHKIHEVIDASPHFSVVSLLAKSSSLIVTALILHLSLIAVGIMFQLFNGFQRIEVDLYLIDLFLIELPSYVTIVGLMVFIQVIVNQRYLGYFVCIALLFAQDILFEILDWDSNLLKIAGTPDLSYSDMNGFGPGKAGALWFQIYWLLFSLLCLLLAGAFWSRGAIQGMASRFSVAKKLLSKYRLATLIVLLLWVGTAGFIYYNTNILNTIVSSDTFDERAAQYEKKYKKYKKAPLPKIKSVDYDIAIYPENREAKVSAVMVLKNESDKNIDSLYFTVTKDWNQEIDITGATLTSYDKDLGFKVYALGSTMVPGEEVRANLTAHYKPKGFENERGGTAIVANGSFFNNFNIVPSLGYSEARELSEKNKRKKYDLPKKNRMPPLEASCKENCMGNYLTDRSSDYIPVTTTISTSRDQIAIAPGTLVKEWEEEGRRYYKYSVDHASLNFYSFMSAAYEVKRAKWNDVTIEVYYDKKHDYNIDKMLSAVERSLDYYTQNFGPYYHKQARIIEFPRYATFAQAFPGTMPYSESFGFIINLEDEEGNNVIDAVIAHEMAHQWWAHQVIGAKMQGGTMLSESFSEYSSLMVMKKAAQDPMKMREFLKYNHDRYLRGRSNEVKKELPLYKVENQGYIHYGKGSLVLYALQDYIGEDKVNTALRNFLEAYRYKSPPYPTTLDFLGYLEPEVPDSLHYLIKDWFKEITLYDNRVKEASYKALDNGRYEVTMDISATKIKADTIGNERTVPLDDWMDIGIFADKGEKRLFYEKRVKIDRNEMSFTFEVDSIPAKVAIDPKRLLIDKVYTDNVETVDARE